MKNAIISHGDLDGIISTVLLIRKFGLEKEENKIYFIQPFEVDKIKINSEVKNFFVVDIAINNRDTEMTKKFIDRLGSRLIIWYDHHEGWPPAEVFEDRPFTIYSKAKSCAEIIGGDPSLEADATAADTRIGDLSQRAALVEQAVKADLSDDNIRQTAVKWLLLGDEESQKILEEAAERYAVILDETIRLTTKFCVDGNLAVVDARESNHQYDLTQLLLAGQKKAPFVVVTVAHPQTKTEGLTIATSRKDVDLVSLFGLPSGAPFRVTLPIERMEEVFAKLIEIT